MAKRRKKEVRLGVIGLGNMGAHHVQDLLDGSVSRGRLTAVCDADRNQRARFKDRAAVFSTSHELLRSDAVDAVLVATPHYSHTTIGIDALGRGLHVLMEKPISVHKADCERLLAAHTRRKQVFAAMFQQRTIPVCRKLKQLIDAGELGKLTRVTWIITDWFRSEAYYASGGWRATWAGEGGGVLLNQCPHQLDMLQWLCGMPSRVRAFAGFGKRHPIEVEDEVTAYLEYPNGATGVFVTSTGEAPGTNRLEIAGDRGKVVCEGKQLTLTRNRVPASTFAKTTRTFFDRPPSVTRVLEPRGRTTGHAGIIQNFVDAILDGKPLIAEAREGIHSVELANAMLESALAGRTVELPLDGKAFERRLRGLIRGSRIRKRRPPAKRRRQRK